MGKINITEDLLCARNRAGTGDPQESGARDRLWSVSIWSGAVKTCAKCCGSTRGGVTNKPFSEIPKVGSWEQRAVTIEHSQSNSWTCWTISSWLSLPASNLSFFLQTHLLSITPIGKLHRVKTVSFLPFPLSRSQSELMTLMSLTPSVRHGGLAKIHLQTESKFSMVHTHDEPPFSVPFKIVSSEIIPCPVACSFLPCGLCCLTYAVLIMLSFFFLVKMILEVLYV